MYVLHNSRIKKNIKLLNTPFKGAEKKFPVLKYDWCTGRRFKKLFAKLKMSNTSLNAWEHYMSLKPNLYFPIQQERWSSPLRDWDELLADSFQQFMQFSIFHLWWNDNWNPVSSKMQYHPLSWTPLKPWNRCHNERLSTNDISVKLKKNCRSGPNHK